MIENIKSRRDFVSNYLHDLGLDIPDPMGGFYTWIPLPKLLDSKGLATEIIEETGVIVFPGIGFGENGEGHIRISLVQDIPVWKQR